MCIYIYIYIYIYNLALLISSCESERNFSEVSILKIKFRSTMLERNTELSFCSLRSKEYYKNVVKRRDNQRYAAKKCRGKKKVYRGMVSRTGLLYPRINPWYSFSEAESTSGYMVLSERTTEKIPSDTTGNRSRDRPTSSAVP